MRRLNTILFAALMFLANLSIGQQLKVKIADKYYNNYEYVEAINRYEEILEGDENPDPVIVRKLAISYHKNHNLVGAEKWYAVLLASDSTNHEALDYYNYAKILQGLGRYDESVKWMDRFIARSQNDSRAIANKEYSEELINELKSDPDRYDIRLTEINSDLDDFSPAYYGDKIIFVSNRTDNFMVKRNYTWNGKPYLDLFVADAGNTGELSNPKPLFKKHNSKYHEGPVTLNKDMSEMYFTRNNYNDGKLVRSSDDVVTLEIYRIERKVSNDGSIEWSNPKPFEYNSKEYSVGHPTLSSDDRYMIFAMDKPGGFGAADLYISTRNEDGTWGTPVNLGDKVNTAGNEMFPFLHANGNLYFASDGLAGLGGLDVFVCPRVGDNFGVPINMGFPLNGPMDDFGLILNEDMNFGYFSSNRDTSKDGDDIYKFRVDVSIHLEVIIVDAETNEPIDTAQLVHYENIESKLLATHITDSTGAYFTAARPKIEYRFEATATGYFGDTVLYTPVYNGIVQKATLIIPLKKEPPVIFAVGEILELPKIYFDRDKYNIRPDAANILDSVVSIMNEHPNLIVECGSHTDCRHTAEYNEWLSQKRAESSVAYIIGKGISPDRISGRGYGEYELTNDCACEADADVKKIGLRKFRQLEDKQVEHCSADDHEVNRRTVFKIVSNTPPAP